jgi:hypothetical protein
LVTAKLFSEAEAVVVKTHFASWLTENRKKGKGVEVDVPADIRAAFGLLREGIQGYFGYDEPLATLITLSGSKVSGLGTRKRSKRRHGGSTLNPFMLTLSIYKGTMYLYPQCSSSNGLLGLWKGTGALFCEKPTITLPSL